MTTYLLDTNHLSPLVTIGHPLRARLLVERQAGHQFALPAPILNSIRQSASFQSIKIVRVRHISYSYNFDNK